MVKFRRFPPPLSSGPGRGPLKAETRVRTSLGAHPRLFGRVFIFRPSHPRGGDARPKHEFEPRWGHTPPVQAGFYFPALSSPWRGRKAETRVRTALSGHTPPVQAGFYFPALSSPWRERKAETRFEPRWGHAPAYSGGFYFPASHPRGGVARPKHEFEPRSRGIKSPPKRWIFS